MSGALLSKSTTAGFKKRSFLKTPNLPRLGSTGLTRNQATTSPRQAWGLFVPLLMFLLGPEISAQAAANGVKVDDAFWAGQVLAIWKFVVRPIAVGGMLVGAATTLYKMRKNLAKGLGRAVKDLRSSSRSQSPRATPWVAGEIPSLSA